MGIPAACADTSGASLTLDTRQGVRRTDLKSLGVIDSGSSAELRRGVTLADELRCEEALADELRRGVTLADELRRGVTLAGEP